jgi:hypothetical protein
VRECPEPLASTCSAWGCLASRATELGADMCLLLGECDWRGRTRGCWPSACLSSRQASQERTMSHVPA